jgi:uncharacterized membrane protein YbhN (UPF0104 family)
VNGRILFVRALVAVVGIATLVSSAAIVLARWDAIAGAATGLRPAWLALGTVVLSLCYGFICVLWWALVRCLGAPLRLGTALHAFALAQLPKYGPGRVVGHGVRASVLRTAGVPVQVTIASLALEGALGLVGALAVAAGGLLLGIRVTDGAVTRWLLLAFGAAIVVGALGLLVRWPHGRWRERLGLAGLAGRRAELVLVAAGYVVNWLPMGLACWLLANAVMPLDATHFLPLLVAVAVATGIGQLAIFAPAGIGVREGALFLFVRAWMPDPQALLFVSLSRAVGIGIEAALTLGATAYSLARASRTPAAPSAPPAD